MRRKAQSPSGDAHHQSLVTAQTTSQVQQNYIISERDLRESGEGVEAGSERHAGAELRAACDEASEAAQLVCVALERRHAAHADLEVAPPVEAHAALRMRPHRHTHAPAVD